MKKVLNEKKTKKMKSSGPWALKPKPMCLSLQIFSFFFLKKKGKCLYLKKKIDRWHAARYGRLCVVYQPRI
jgi:hypothetical protein